MSLLRLLTGLVTTLGLVLAIASLKKDFPGEIVVALYTDWRLLDFKVLTTRADIVLFVLIVILSISAAIVALMLMAISTKKKARNLDFLLQAGSYFPDTCDDVSLSYIARAGSERFSSATDETETKEIHRADPVAFKVVRDVSRRPVGYYCILRLTPAGVDAVEKGTFSLKKLQHAHIRQDKKFTECDIYIGAINCTAYSLRAPGFIEGYAIRDIQNMRPKRIYARAATARGLKLLANYGFTPVASSREGINEFYSRKGYQ